jgi:dihydroflavonol-4-reductase
MMEEQTVRKGRVLVTGAGGFLGANIVWALREHGFTVRALVRRPPGGPQWEGLDGVEFAIGDIRNPGLWPSVLDGVRTVIHVAALTRLIPRPRRDSFAVNVEATRVLCAAALRAGIRRLVFTASASAIAPGTSDRPNDEDSPPNRDLIPAPYYTSKRLAERVVRSFDALGLETVTLCPAYVLGPRDVRPTTNQLLLLAARWPRLAMPPGGMNVVDVREVALAHVRALWLGEANHRYLLAGAYRSYVQVARVVKRIVGKNDRVPVMPPWLYYAGSAALAVASGILPHVPNELAVPSFQYGFVSYHLSGAKADHTFGLRHRPPEETIYDTLRWFRDKGLVPWLPTRLHSPTDSDASAKCR